MLKITDDSRIAADEWMLFPIALVGLPIWELPWWMMAIFFVVVRFIDIIKPYPANRLQSLPGGRGIVADDFVANLYALGINWAIYAII
jgi:phosphatidylglycerophosphatase A